ncbi:phage tail protein [Musicola keenii]|uniref:phage tail protein n=1 Tax=Musicola keenii TaxID=2884250 RepID=UPI00177B58A9|nr:phage tail protein [Musicola keenii]
MKKTHSIDLTLGKENFYKNNRVRIDNISVCCCKCADESVDSLKALIGIPQPWPLADAPEGWLKCNGQAFDTATYPELAKCYPSGTLPDLRGEFIRGWDDSRNIDTNRELLSVQTDAIRNITGSLYYGADADVQLTESYSSGALYYDLNAVVKDTKNSVTWTTSSTVNAWAPTIFDASRVVPTASENRPRNIAFNYIVKVG